MLIKKRLEKKPSRFFFSVGTRPLRLTGINRRGLLRSDTAMCGSECWRRVGPRRHIRARRHWHVVTSRRRHIIEGVWLTCERESLLGACACCRLPRLTHRLSPILKPYLHAPRCHVQFFGKLHSFFCGRERCAIVGLRQYFELSSIRALSLLLNSWLLGECWGDRGR